MCAHTYVHLRKLNSKRKKKSGRFVTFYALYNIQHNYMLMFLTGHIKSLLNESLLQSVWQLSYQLSCVMVLFRFPLFSM